VPVLVDAGVGTASDAAEAMELGADAAAPTVVPSKSATGPDKAATRAWMRAAATILLAVGLGFALWFFRPSTAPVGREPATALIQSQLKEGEAVPRENFWLRWSSGSAGVRYDVTVTTADLDVIVTARGLERSEYRIPPERLAGLPAGARVLWRVVAQNADGGTISSPTFEVSIR